MEKPYKIMISIVAVLLCWLASSGFSDDLSNRIQVDKSIATTGSSIFLAEELPFVPGFAVKDGDSSWAAGNVTPGLYKQHQLYKAIVCTLEVKVACAILQNISQLDNNPVRIRKSDMLFPFHYFF